jgi:hypothetical protein
VTPTEQAAWREGVNVAAEEARKMARRMRGYVANDPPDTNGKPHIMTLETLSHANLLEQFAEKLSKMAAQTEPTGLEYRGG